MGASYRFRNLSGMTFGRWTVIAFAGRSSYGLARWRCRCECGTERVLFCHNLIQGRTKSCGCYQAEFNRVRLRAAFELLAAVENQVDSTQCH